MSEKPKKTFFGNLFGGGNNPAKNESKSNEIRNENESELEIVDAISESSTITESDLQLSDFSVVEESEDLLEEVTPEYYRKELIRYETHIKKYRQKKIKYDKILEEYEGEKTVFNNSLTGFSELARQIKDGKGIYNVDFEDYAKHKKAYEEIKSTYEASREKHAELSQSFLNLRNEIGLKEAALKDSNLVIHELAQDYEEQISIYAKNERTVTNLVEDFDQTQLELQQLFNEFEALTETYQAEKPVYDKAKDRYDFATRIKNDYQTLSRQSEQMQKQEDAAKANLGEIRDVRNSTQDRMDISTKVDKFINEPLENFENVFVKEDQKFHELESKYRVIKERYDEESSNFARIQENYEILSASKSANRVALHYVTEEYNGAKEILTNIEEEYNPLNREYQKEKTAHSIISKNFDALKIMMDEAKENVEVSQRAAIDAQKTYDKVEEAYGYISTQNSILKQNLATKEAQYKEFKDDYVDIVTLFEKEKETFGPINTEYQDMKEKHDALELKVFNTRNEVQRARAALKQSKENLLIATEEFGAAKLELEKKQEAVEAARNQLSRLEAESQEISLGIKTQLATAKERYALTSDKYRIMTKRYSDFMTVHTNYAKKHGTIVKEHDKVSSLWRLADEEFWKINQAYQDFEAHGNKVTDLYETIMKIYMEDKDYYDYVYEEYTKLQVSKKEVIARKAGFDMAAQSLKTLLVLDSNLTFPIYEATGQNYVDSYNLPTIEKVASGAAVLKNKTQLNSWLSTYNTLHSALITQADFFSVALNNYERSYKSYRQAGGERLSKIDSNELAYTGIDLSHYMKLLEEQVASWRGEYSVREEAFASLVVAYNDYLEREIQLINLVTSNVSAQGGVQAVINHINGISDFVDLYSSTYGDVNVLAKYLAVDPSELTKPKSEESLIQFLHDNYYRRAVHLIEKNLSAFINNLNALKPDYEKVLDVLHKELKHFEISTGISISQINITGILNSDIDLKAYLTAGLENNYEKLRNTVKSTSSIVNIIRKANTFSKVANRTIDTTVDSTLVFPDKPISMSQELLNTDVVIYESKAVPIPVQPDKPEKTTMDPIVPSVLPKRPDFIEMVREPEAISAIAQ